VVSRNKQREDFEPNVRITLLEQDLDMFDRTLERTNNILRGILVKAARSRAAMSKALGAPVQRRPDTKTLLAASIQDPASVPPQGREALMGFLRDRYGEAAHNVAPWILDQFEQGDQQAQVEQQAVEGEQL
jgi:hypothetical protein